MSAFATLTDRRLLAELHALVRNDRSLEAQLLAHLGEVDKRRLSLGEACSSMFGYCVDVLHFSEARAFKRIAAARAAREHPELLEAVRRGELHVTAVRLLAPHLTSENSAALIAESKHRTAEQIKRLLADLHPKREVATSIRRVATPVTDAVSPPRAMPSLFRRGSEVASSTEPIVLAPAGARPVVQAAPSFTPKPEPLGRDRYNVRFTASSETHTQLRELQALLRHKFPAGDLGSILVHAVAMLQKQVLKQKFAKREEPRRKVEAKSVDSSGSKPEAAGKEPEAAGKEPEAAGKGPEASGKEKEASEKQREGPLNGRRWRLEGCGSWLIRSRERLVEGSRRQFAAPSRNETTDVAPTWHPPGAAATRETSSNFTMRSPGVVPDHTRSTTSLCAVAPTINTQPIETSAANTWQSSARQQLQIQHLGRETALIQDRDGPVNWP